MIESLEFKSKSKHLKTFAEWVRGENIGDILHYISMETYKSPESKAHVDECFRSSIEAIAIQVCRDNSKYKAYLKKGY